MNDTLPTSDIESLHGQIRGLIEAARDRVLVQVNQALVLTYWQIGRAIRTDLLCEDRAEYGAGVLKQLAQRLSREYGPGFSYSSLTRMTKLYDCLSDQQTVATLSQQLSWSHFVELIKLDDPTKRDFYIGMCAEGRWSVRTLRERSDAMLFERTAISKQPEEVVRRELTQLRQSGEASPSLFLKDPYLLDFLDLNDNFSERDLENGILRELERFILELGSDFAFMGRQKRIQIGGHDYVIDLLFFHRKLRETLIKGILP